MSWPQNVGIKALDIYFPSLYVEQSQLEIHDGVGRGKYTIGLGQTRMGFCDDREDVYSIALTVVSSLMRKYSISPASIGRLEVGTETLLDKSKSVKTVLMQLFTACGNTNVEGVDTINACYGGTNALFNAVNWIESRAWDGRDALVVAGDIAVYSKGPARPTGGAGAVAMLVGANAPIVVEPRRRGSYMQHVYDFYKPDLSSEYPVVDGKLSNECYTRALDACYSAYSKAQADGMINGDIGNNGEVNGHVNGEICETIQESEVIRPASGLDEFDYMCFHTPNCKLVAKSYARLLYNDYCSNPDKEIFKAVPPEFRKMSYEESLADRTIENIFMKLSEAAFTKRVQPSIQIPKCCGNMYTASLYSSLASLLSNVTSTDLGGKRIGLFSYGSGCASSMFSMKVVGDTTRLADAMDVEYRLQARKVATPENYEEIMELCAKAFLQKNYTPVGDINRIQKGAYYLSHVDHLWRRVYLIRE